MTQCSIDLTSELCNSSVIHSVDIVDTIYLDDTTYVIQKISKHLVVRIDGNSVHPWIDKLNCLSIVRKYDLDRIKSIIRKQHIPTRGMVGSKAPSVSRVKKEFPIDTAIDKKIQMERERTKIKNVLVSYTDRKAVKNGTMVSNQKTNIFVKDQRDDIIITDYMKLYEELVFNKNKISGSIDIINNNPYFWRITINCKDNITSLPFEWNNVVIEMNLHKELHPSYPPFVKIVKPILDNNLNDRITRSKFTMLEYWALCRTPFDIVVRTLNVIKKYGILKCDVIDEIDSDHKPFRVSNSSKNSFTKVQQNAPMQNIKQKDNGVGYGYDYHSNWDIEEYKRAMVEKNLCVIERLKCATKAVSEVVSIFAGNLKWIVHLIKRSSIMKYLIKELRTTSLLDMFNNIACYKSIFKFIISLCLYDTIELFYDRNP